MTRRHLLWKCVPVLALMAPLVVLEGWRGAAPAWLAYRLGGIPLTLVTSVAVMVALVGLSVFYSAASARSTRKS